MALTKMAVDLHEEFFTKSEVGVRLTLKEAAMVVNAMVFVFENRAQYTAQCSSCPDCFQNILDAYKKILPMVINGIDNYKSQNGGPDGHIQNQS